MMLLIIWLTKLESLYLQNNNIQLTIIIPTYNRLKLLKEALISVQNQTSINSSLVILNNASTDGTKKYLDSYKLKKSITNIVHNDFNIGLVANINKGFSISKTKWVTILSDDDILNENFVKELNYILPDIKSGMLVVGHRIIDGNNNMLKSFTLKNQNFSLKDSFFSLFNEKIHIAGISGVIFNQDVCSRELFMKGFPNGLYSDFDMYYRIAIGCGISTIDSVLYTRRQWEDNTSSLKLNFSLLKKLYLQKKAYKLFRNNLFQLIINNKNLFSTEEFQSTILKYNKNYNNSFIIELLRNKISLLRRK